MQTAYLNRTATAVPAHEVHRYFLDFATAQLDGDPRRQAVFRRMADKGGIEHRYSCLIPTDDPQGPSVDAEGVYARGSFPGTGRRMDLFEQHAPALAQQAVEKLLPASERAGITHLVVTSCTVLGSMVISCRRLATAGLMLSW